MFYPVLRIQIRIRIRILRNKYADPRIWIQGVKYQPNTEKKTCLLLKPKFELIK